MAHFEIGQRFAKLVAAVSLIHIVAHSRCRQVNLDQLKAGSPGV
jgi:hypothetical protein